MPEPAPANDTLPAATLTLYSAGAAGPRRKRKRKVSIADLYAAARGESLDPAAFMSPAGWSPLPPVPAAGPPVGVGAGPVVVPGIRSVRR